MDNEKSHVSHPKISPAATGTICYKITDSQHKALVGVGKTSRNIIISLIKVAGNAIKMHVTHFGRPQLYKIMLGTEILCVMYVVFCVSMFLGIYSSKTQEMREFLPEYGQDTRELIS